MCFMFGVAWDVRPAPLSSMKQRIYIYIYIYIYYDAPARYIYRFNAASAHEGRQTHSSRACTNEAAADCREGIPGADNTNPTDMCMFWRGCRFQEGDAYCTFAQDEAPQQSLAFARACSLSARIVITPGTSSSPPSPMRIQPVSGRGTGHHNNSFVLQQQSISSMPLTTSARNVPSPQWTKCLTMQGSAGGGARAST